MRTGFRGRGDGWRCRRTISQRIHSECAKICVARIPEENAIVIDLSAAFGCPESAGSYSILGESVAFIHDSSTGHAHATRFYNYHWVDDHVNVGPDVGLQ
ncbi:Secreted protein [Phytophthora palmivora]|uniref:Secreted protein n=1 Tax=Phytophthora palmivora TaxID=4796 RepID=A0A2P4YFD7_9STRA|nr:Secreted protein [Phytophthora palmivora]